MKLIKLDAIDFTNDFLKGLANKQYLENFTIVTAESQTKGKGQMGSVWISEKGKNLTMSVFVKDSLTVLNQIYSLNIAVSRRSHWDKSSRQMQRPPVVPV